MTGGGRGVGRAISLQLAASGADVAVNFRRDEASAEATAAEIRAMGRRAVAVQASIDDESDDEQMVERVSGELGDVTILVNNAGLASRGRPVHKTDADEVQRLMATHAFGPHYLCRFVLPAMKQAPRADIVFISSVAATSHGAFGAPYSMAKAAMESLAFTLAKEIHGTGIRVNVVAPGLIETEMGRRLVKGAAGIDDIHSLDERSPYGRVCQPEDISNVVHYLCSDANGYVNGARIVVNGGGGGF